VTAWAVAVMSRFRSGPNAIRRLSWTLASVGPQARVRAESPQPARRGGPGPKPGSDRRARANLAGRIIGLLKSGGRRRGYKSTNVIPLIMERRAASPRPPQPPARRGHHDHRGDGRRGRSRYQSPLASSNRQDLWPRLRSGPGQRGERGPVTADRAAGGAGAAAARDRASPPAGRRVERVTGCWASGPSRCPCHGRTGPASVESRPGLPRGATECASSLAG
jgi:hypothetical protein